MLSGFAVLRRSHEPQDALPAGAGLVDAITGAFTTYQPAGVRRLGTVPGGAIYLVSGVAATPRVSRACRSLLSAAQLTALKASAGLIPAGAGYCLLEYAPYSLGRDSCGSYAAVAHGFALAADSEGPETDYLGLVPNGVGTVTLRFAAPQAPVSLTVTDNLASGRAPAGFISPPSSVVRSPARLRAYLDRVLPISINWVAATGGHVLRTFPRPRGLVSDELAEIDAVDSLP